MMVDAVLKPGGRERDSVRNFCHAPVMVVVNDPFERRLICDLLDELGYDTVEAGDGVEAQVALTCQRVSVVLLDLSLPFMNGRELLRRIAEDEETQTPPVVVLSGDSDIWDRVSTRGLGVSAFLRRPIQRKAVSDTLVRLGVQARPRPRMPIGPPRSETTRDDRRL